MNYHHLALTFNWWAVVVGLLGFYAQFRRAITHGVEGISLGTWSLFLTTGFYWIAYGAAVGSWSIALGSLVVLPMQLIVFFRLSPWRRRRVVLQSTAVIVAVAVVPALGWGWSAGLFGLGAIMAVIRMPQIIELVRQSDAEGVSVGLWLWGVANALLWVLYYQQTAMWAPLVATAVAGVTNVVVAVLAHWRHRQARRRVGAAVLIEG